MKKVLSYIWPQSEKRPSQYNGILELTMLDGRLVLDSANANYSYGSLQRILEQGLKEVDIQAVSSTLLLGLGGGSVIQSLKNKYAYTGQIDAVEIDPTIIEIASEYFDIDTSSDLEIFNADAHAFVEDCLSTYDLIIVDLFIDNTVPSQFYAEQFSEAISRLLNPNGYIIYNLGINNNNSVDERKKTVAYFNNLSDYTCKLLEKIDGTNMMLVVKKKN